MQMLGLDRIIEESMAQPIQVVVTANDIPYAQQAIRDGLDMGWTLMAFDMTQERPVVVFERPRDKKPEPTAGESKLV